MTKETNGKAHDEEMGFPDEQVPLLSKAMQDEGEQEILDCGGSDILQFSAPVCFADETEGSLKVDIIRLGTMKGRVAAKFATKDMSAKSDEQYGSVSGQLVFEDGEHTKTIDIPILEDSDWTPTLEFEIQLTHAQNCDLGLYLHHCRVKILNFDKFPTDKYAEEIDKGHEAISEIDDWGLFREYCKLNFDSAGVKLQTAFILIFDQLHNIVLFGNLWVGVYIVDTLFARGGASSSQLIVPNNRYHTALLIGLWFVVPLVILQAWDTLKTWLDIKGTSRAFLQKSMLRTYMDFTADSRAGISPAELDMVIEESAAQCAASYVAALDIVGSIGKIGTVALFIVLFQPDHFAVYTVLLLPSVLVAFTALRVAVAQRAQKRTDQKALVVASMTNEAYQKFRLIADYMKRPLMGDLFAKAVDEHCEAKIPVAMIELNTAFTTKFLSGLAICLYISLKAPDVLDGTVSLGIFLATITIFASHMSDAIMQLNIKLMVIIEAFVPLKEFTTLLNLPLELPALKAANRYRRQRTAIRRSELLKAGALGEGVCTSDAIQIEATDLSFEYPNDSEVPGPSPTHMCVLKNVNISVPQGSIVAVVGPHDSGKSTFFSLLSNILMPTSGQVYVPSHLRVLHVARDPMFLQAPLLHNLALGLPQHMLDVDRIKDILQMLGLEDMVPILERDLLQSAGDATLVDISDFKDIGWERSMNQSRRAKLHVARALIANPEVLVLQRALQAFDESVASDLIDILRKHVQEKGLCLPEEGRGSRRPRNVFFCTESVAQAAKADTIWQVQPENKTIVSVTPESLLAASTPRRIFSRQTNAA